MLINVICPSVLKCFHLHLAELEPTSTNLQLTSTNLNPALQPTNQHDSSSLRIALSDTSNRSRVPSSARSPLALLWPLDPLWHPVAFGASPCHNGKLQGTWGIPKCSQNQWEPKIKKTLQISSQLRWHLSETTIWDWDLKAFILTKGMDHIWVFSEMSFPRIDRLVHSDGGPLHIIFESVLLSQKHPSKD